MSSEGNCIGCGTELDCRDDDPNGDGNCTCAKCRAEEGHDFDRAPDVKFSRAGSMFETCPKCSEEYSGDFCIKCTEKTFVSDDCPKCKELRGEVERRKNMQPTHEGHPVTQGALNALISQRDEAWRQLGLQGYQEKNEEEVQVRVPPVCLCCGSKWKGGSQVPLDKFRVGLRVFYYCGASLSVARYMGTGCYMLRFKNCKCGECQMKEG